MVGRWAKRVGIAAAAVAAVTASGFAYHRHRYPYGWSHCCDKGLRMGLLQYADQHDGWFPRGQTTPEASLSLLYGQDPYFGDILPGKTVSPTVVRPRLEAGLLLSPE